MEILIIAIIIILLIAYGIHNLNQQEKYNKGLMSDNEKYKYERKLERREEDRKRRTIKQVIIVGNESDSRKKVGSSVMRGAVGGALLGPAGMVGGALSGKNKITSKTTFLIEYEDGHKETKVVDNKSYEFDKLCKYIKM